MGRSARSGPVKKAFEKEDVQAKWESTAWCKKLAMRKKRTTLTDFDRFKLKLAKQKVGFLACFAFVFLAGKSRVAFTGISCLQELHWSNTTKAQLKHQKPMQNLMTSKNTTQTFSLALIPIKCNFKTSTFWFALCIRWTLLLTLLKISPPPPSILFYYYNLPPRGGWWTLKVYCPINKAPKRPGVLVQTGIEPRFPA